MISIKEAYQKAKEEIEKSPENETIHVVEPEPIQESPSRITGYAEDFSFESTKDYVKERIGSFSYPLFIRGTLHNKGIKNWVTQKIADYATVRSDRVGIWWYDFIVPDQYQEELGCKWITIEGDGFKTHINKLFK